MHAPKTTEELLSALESSSCWYGLTMTVTIALRYSRRWRPEPMAMVGSALQSHQKVRLQTVAFSGHILEFLLLSH